MPNWAMAAAGDCLVGPLAVTWSVAIEEQYYLVWPLVVWALRPRSLAWACALIVGGSLALRVYGQANGWDPISLYVSTLARLDALAIGSLAAVAMRAGFDVTRWRQALVATFIVACALAAWGDLSQTLASNSDRYAVTTWSLGLGITLGAIAAVSLLLLLASPEDSPKLTRLLEASWLRSFGLYSYGIYLTHSPVRAVVRDYVYGPGSDGTTPLVTFPTVSGSLLPALTIYMAICVPLCWTVGWLSYRLIEFPCLRLKQRFKAEAGGTQ
ncbi:MAG: acyltransferase [Planctomycetota bacterium]